MATSVPAAPMATPMSDMARAGASFTPSPTIMTVPSVLQLADDLQFVLGQQLGMHFIDLRLAGDGVGDEAVVAGEHDDFFDS